MKKSLTETDKKYKILKASKKLFLAKGFMGASMSKIAEEAGVTKSLLYHHFSDKEELWQSVKSLMVEEHFKEPPKAIDHTKFVTFKDYLKKILALRFDFYTHNPEVPRLINWERLQGGKVSLYGNTPISPKTWIPAFKYFQEQKMIRDDIPAEKLVIFTSSAISATSIDMLNVYYEDKDKEDYLGNLIDLIHESLNLTK